MIQRQYYVAGQIAEGQNLNAVIERCTALNLPVPTVALTLTRTPQVHSESVTIRRRAVTTCRSMDARNVRLAYDGRVKVGWSGIEACASTDKRKQQALQTGAIKQVLGHLGSLLSIGRQPHGDGMTADAIPDDVTHLVRDSIAEVHGSHIDISSMAASFDQRLSKIEGEAKVATGVFVSSIFTRERAIRASKRTSEKQMVVEMPEGARSVIARASGHVLVSSDSHRVIQTIDPRPVVILDQSSVRYSGTIKQVDIRTTALSIRDINVINYISTTANSVQITWKNGQTFKLRPARRTTASSISWCARNTDPR